MYVSPVGDLVGVDAQEKVLGEVGAAKGTVQRLLVDLMVESSRDVLAVLDDPFGALVGALVGQIQVGVFRGSTMTVDVHPGKLILPDPHQLLVGSTGVCRSEVSDAHLLGGFLEGQHFQSLLGCLIVVVCSASLRSLAFLGVWISTGFEIFGQCPGRCCSVVWGR